MYTIGLDEAGRGTWAGPLAVGAVGIEEDLDLPKGVADSKKLSAKIRLNLYEKILNFDHSIGWVSAEEIDTLGLTQATQLGMIRAIENILAKKKLTQSLPKELKIIMDGYDIFGGEYPNLTSFDIAKVDWEFYTKAEDKFPVVASASILAKVVRDKLMNDLDKQYPKYEFSKHKGYGTRIHKDCLEKLGPIKGIHRLSFEPLKRHL